jgi:ketosteroid isomerase-like protein
MTNAKQVTDKFWQLFEAGDLDAIEPLLDPDFSFKMPGAEMRGFAAMKAMLTGYRVAFPDLSHKVKHFVESGDTVALELDVKGTHTGPMITPAGPIPPSGKQVVWESCDYIRVRGGRILSWHVYHDSSALQAALAPQPRA